MDSFTPSTGTRYRYTPTNPTRMDDDDDNDAAQPRPFAGMLEIYVHHATNIHNICIYDDQDVYAKFSLTYNPDDTLSTRIVNGGGKNPQFNQKLLMKVAHSDAVLKCEIWMFSRARNLMEDQLLGFALVQISGIIGKGQVSGDYTLSSTDLFHSPAGTVKLTLCLTPSVPAGESNSSISSEVVLFDSRISEVVVLDPVEYSRIEFPDIGVVKQNQEMVSEYFHRKLGSFLHLGSSPLPPVFHDCEMTSGDGGSVSPVGSAHASSGFLSSTTTSLSDDRNSSESKEKKGGGWERSSSSAYLNVSVPGEVNQSSSSSSGCPDTPTSRKGSETKDRAEGREEGNGNSVEGGGKYGQVALVPNMSLEAEQSAMQQQIVDMYMRSMQQFTESLAKMKLPMDLDKPRSDGGGELAQPQRESGDRKLEDLAIQQQQQKKKKDGSHSRVFYGSRAFF